MADESEARARLRVGFDSRWYNRTGVGAYVFGLLGALVQLQDEIELFVYEDPADPVPLREGATVRRISLKAGKYSISEQIELAWHCRRDRLDVFHSPFYIVPLFAPCPVVVTFHDLIPFLFPIHPWPKNAVVRSGYRMAAVKAQHIIADSQNTAHDVQRVLGIKRERISVVHLAAGDCYIAEAGPGELEIIREKHDILPPYVMVSSARNWQTKNLETALQVLDMARQQSAVGFQTIVYGSPEGLGAAGGEARWRMLNMKYCGYLCSEDLARLFRRATVFVTTSLYEGFGLPMLEAMSCGCAVVGSRGGALAEIAGNGAQVFDPLDVTGMASAVSALLRDEANLKWWRDAGLRRSSQFSWLKAARETVSVYHQARNNFASRGCDPAHKCNLMDEDRVECGR